MFSLQSYMGHHLTPGNYGRAFALVGFYGIVTRPARSFGRQVAWHMSRRSLEETLQPSLADSVLLRLTLWLFAAGIVIGIISTVSSGTLAIFFHTSRSEILATAWGAPFLLGIQTLKGALEGERRFVIWSAINILVPALYVIGVVSLIDSFKVLGVLLALSLGTVIGFFVCIVVLWRSLYRALKAPMKVPWRSDLPFLTNGIVATLTNGVFLSADVIAVQHYFAHQISGQYAIVAAIGNVLFSATTGIVNVMFPYVADRQHKGLSSRPIVLTVIAIFALGSIFGAVFLQVFGSEALRVFAGVRYIGGATYLGWYAIGMGILSWSTALLHAQTARNSFKLLWASVPALATRLLLLLLFHNSPKQIVLITDGLALSFAITLFVMFLQDEKAMLSKTRSRAVEFQVNSSTIDQAGPK